MIFAKKCLFNCIAYATHFGKCNKKTHTHKNRATSFYLMCIFKLMLNDAQLTNMCFFIVPRVQKERKPELSSSISDLVVLFVDGEIASF